MNPIRLFLTGALLTVCFLFVTSCSQGAVAESSNSRIVLVGSTPGDAELRSMLAIPEGAKIDFVRWELTLNQGDKAANTFLLNLVYGEGKPNTPDFIQDNKLSLKGKYEIVRSSDGPSKKEVYRLTSDDPRATLSLVKINDNLFHVLTAENKLMVGNGGWSYTLNRKEPLANADTSLPVLAVAPLSNNRSTETIFGGRTPCSEVAREYKFEVPAVCFKIKWKLTLYRDPATLQPTTYTIYRTDHRSSLIQGKWTAGIGTGANAGAVIYRLDPEKGGQSPSFLLADENVLFILDKNERLFTGNGDFSYTLDRSIKP